MKVKDFAKIMQKIAPENLKESYDNVGLMVGDEEKEVHTVLLSLDCTLDVIEEAAKENAELIFSHHPLIFRKPSSVTTGTLQGRKIMELIKKDISLYSAHTNFDSVCGGLNDSLMELLELKRSAIMEKSKADDKSGIGRIVDVEETTLEELIEKVKKSLKINCLRFTGEIDKKVKRIAVINGSGQDYFDYALQMGADVVITGDTTYHFAADYTEMNLSIIDAGHFDTEWMAFLKAAKRVEEEVKKIDNNVSFKVASSTRSPYKYI